MEDFFVLVTALAVDFTAGLDLAGAFFVAEGTAAFVAAGFFFNGIAFAEDTGLDFAGADDFSAGATAAFSALVASLTISLAAFCHPGLAHSNRLRGIGLARRQRGQWAS